MKKILFAIAIVMILGLTASAQGRDSFFGNYDNAYSNREGEPSVVFPDHNTTEDPDAPLGSGLLVLTVLGAGYAVARKRSKK